LLVYRHLCLALRFEHRSIALNHRPRNSFIDYGSRNALNDVSTGLENWGDSSTHHRHNFNFRKDNLKDYTLVRFRMNLNWAEVAIKSVMNELINLIWTLFLKRDLSATRWRIESSINCALGLKTCTKSQEHRQHQGTTSTRQLSKRQMSNRQPRAMIPQSLWWWTAWMIYQFCLNVFLKKTLCATRKNCTMGLKALAKSR
jgi:hypothetical protein